MTASARQRAGVMAIGAGIGAIAGAIVLHHLHVTIDGTSATISRWHTVCTSVAGPAVSDAIQSRCGEISLAEHATAGLVLLAAVLGVIGIRLLRASASARPAGQIAG